MLSLNIFFLTIANILLTSVNILLFFKDVPDGNRQTSLFLSFGFVLTGLLSIGSLIYDLEKIEIEISWLTDDHIDSFGDFFTKDFISSLLEKIGKRWNWYAEVMIKNGFKKNDQNWSKIHVL